jgi:hypothetical protein
MSTIFRAFQFCLGGCRHSHTFRERRQLHGVDVLHLVCHECGHAVPAIQRTAEEHQQIVEAGAIKALRAHRAPADVIVLEARRGRQRTAAAS